MFNAVKNLVYNFTERDVSKQVVYSVPSDYITSPDSMFYKEMEVIVQTELDYLYRYKTTK